jgi:hypothetical protein
MEIINEGFDACPLPIQNKNLNVKNHLKAIEEDGLGAPDPTQPNNEFWQDKARKWNCTEGDARGRLCNNCRYYYNTTFIKDCIANSPIKDMKASQLPIKPKWADIESTPQAYCTLLDITCSPVRTCDHQLMGGAIDDEKINIGNYAQILKDDINELPDSTEEL